MGVPRIGRRPKPPIQANGVIVLMPEQSMFTRGGASAWECLTVDGVTVFSARAAAPVQKSVVSGLPVSSQGVLLYIPSISYDITMQWLMDRGPRPPQGPVDPRTPAPTAGRVVEDDDS